MTNLFGTKAYAKAKEGDYLQRPDLDTLSKESGDREVLVIWRSDFDALQSVSEHWHHIAVTNREIAEDYRREVERLKKES